MSIRRNRNAPVATGDDVSSSSPSILHTQTGFAITASGALGFASDLEHSTALYAMNAAGATEAPVVENISCPRSLKKEDGSSSNPLGVACNRDAWKRMDITCTSIVEPESTPAYALKKLAAAAERQHEQQLRMHDNKQRPERFSSDRSTDTSAPASLFEMKSLGALLFGDAFEQNDKTASYMGAGYGGQSVAFKLVMMQRPAGVSEDAWKHAYEWAQMVRIEELSYEIFKDYVNKEKYDGPAKDKEVKKEFLRTRPFAAYRQIKESNTDNVDFDYSALEGAIMELAQQWIESVSINKPNYIYRNLDNIIKRSTQDTEKLLELTEIREQKEKVARLYQVAVQATHAIEKQHGIVFGVDFAKNMPFYSTLYLAVPSWDISVKKDGKRERISLRSIANKFRTAREIEGWDTKKKMMPQLDPIMFGTKVNYMEVREAIMAVAPIYEDLQKIGKPGKEGKDASELVKKFHEMDGLDEDTKELIKKTVHAHFSAKKDNGQAKHDELHKKAIDAVKGNDAIPEDQKKDIIAALEAKHKAGAHGGNNNNKNNNNNNNGRGNGRGKRNQNNNKNNNNNGGGGGRGRGRGGNGQNKGRSRSRGRNNNNNNGGGNQR